MILRQKNLGPYIVVGFLFLLALLGNAKEITSHQTDFLHPPNRFFYFDDSSVYSILDDVDCRYCYTMSVGMFTVPMMME